MTKVKKPIGGFARDGSGLVLPLDPCACALCLVKEDSRKFPRYFPGKEKGKEYSKNVQRKFLEFSKIKRNG